MQRDMDKLRALLMIIESGNQHAVPGLVPDATEYVAHAIELGLLTGMEWGSGSHKQYPPASLQLTPAGHEFVNLARDQLIWNDVAQRIKDRTGTTSYAIWLNLLDAEHKRTLSA